MSGSEGVSSGVTVEVVAGVGRVRLDRPARLNALDTAAKEALRDGLAGLAADPSVRVVTLTGTGRAYCVGQDLAEHAMPKPVLAVVNGVAAGAGASLCFLADLRLFAASASVTTAFAGVGLAFLAREQPRFTGR